MKLLVLKKNNQLCVQEHDLRRDEVHDLFQFDYTFTAEVKKYLNMKMNTEMEYMNEKTSKRKDRNFIFIDRNKFSSLRYQVELDNPLLSGWVNELLHCQPHLSLTEAGLLVYAGVLMLASWFLFILFFYNNNTKRYTVPYMAIWHNAISL